MSKRSFGFLNKSEPGGYVQFPHIVLRSQSFTNLSAHAIKLMTDLLSQFYGSNNGDLCATYSLMHKRGWKSKGTLNRAIKELVSTGFIEVSRQGGRHKCSLFALTFYAVDECKGKLEIMHTTKPKSLWRKGEPLPDIKKLQEDKIAKDDAKLLKALLERNKRFNKIENPSPNETQLEANCPSFGSEKSSENASYPL